MTATIITIVISVAVNIGCVFLTYALTQHNRKTDNDKTKEDILSKTQESLKLLEQSTTQEFAHIKEDLKEHNGYAKLFAESMPVVQEKIKVINHRLDDLEKKVG